MDMYIKWDRLCIISIVQCIFNYWHKDYVFPYVKWGICWQIKEFYWINQCFKIKIPIRWLDSNDWFRNGFRYLEWLGLTRRWFHSDTGWSNSIWYLFRLIYGWCNSCQYPKKYYSRKSQKYMAHWSWYRT